MREDFLLPIKKLGCIERLFIQWGAHLIGCIEEATKKVVHLNQAYPEDNPDGFLGKNNWIISLAILSWVWNPLWIIWSIWLLFYFIFHAIWFSYNIADKLGGFPILWMMIWYYDCVMILKFKKRKIIIL